MTTSRDKARQEANVAPACEATLVNNDSRWQTKEAAVYPPGHIRLCGDPACFGPFLSFLAGMDGGRTTREHSKEVDHRDLTETLVRSDNATSHRVYHLPAGADASIGPEKAARVRARMAADTYQVQPDIPVTDGGEEADK